MRLRIEAINNKIVVTHPRRQTAKMEFDKADACGLHECIYRLLFDEMLCEFEDLGKAKSS